MTDDAHKTADAKEALQRARKLAIARTLADARRPVWVTVGRMLRDERREARAHIVADRMWQ